METTIPVNEVIEPTSKVVKPMSQKDAVYQHVVDTLTEEGLSLTDEIKVLLRSKKGDLSDDNKALVKGLKSKIRAKILAGLNSGDIAFKQNAKTPAKTYCSGLLNSWLQKHELFQ